MLEYLYCSPTLYSPLNTIIAVAMAEEQSEETKQEARGFMTGLVGSGVDTDAVEMVGTGIDMKKWKELYAASTTKERKIELMEKFWSEMYHPASVSLWLMTYDEAQDNENLPDTMAIATAFMEKSESLKDHCFGVIHTLEDLTLEGLWMFNGPDPETLFGCNEDTSWFSWSQIGPDANEHVKSTVNAFWAPANGKLKEKIVKDTQAF